jgi:hypothetical protein
VRTLIHSISNQSPEAFVQIKQTISAPDLFLLAKRLLHLGNSNEVCSSTVHPKTLPPKASGAISSSEFPNLRFFITTVRSSFPDKHFRPMFIHLGRSVVVADLSILVTLPSN